MHESRGSNETVFDRHRASGRTKRGKQLRPSHPRLRLPRQAVQPLNAFVKPPFQPSSALPLGQEKDAEPDFAEDERVDGDVGLMLPQPVDDLGIWRGLGGFAQDVRVDEELHSVSVDSDSIGTKKFFSGQPSSQSTTPSLGRVGRRTSLYSPRSTRSTSNSCPASI